MRLIRAAIQRDSQDIVIQLTLITEYIPIPGLCIRKRRPVGPSYNTDELIDKRETDGTAIVRCRRALFLVVECCFDAVCPFEDVGRVSAEAWQALTYGDASSGQCLGIDWILSRIVDYHFAGGEC